MSSQTSNQQLELIHTPAGKGVRALQDIPTGTRVLQFDGPIVPWSGVPAEEVIYVMMADTGNWVIPNAPARFLNHSCAPNLRFLADRGAESTRAITAGEELTISYHVLESFDVERRERHPDWYFWDDRWSFDCLCGAVNCRGRIEGYVMRDQAGN